MFMMILQMVRQSSPLVHFLPRSTIHLYFIFINLEQLCHFQNIVIAEIYFVQYYVFDIIFVEGRTKYMIDS
jgi:hypothetical protein